jgi:hypothetical protein
LPKEIFKIFKDPRESDSTVKLNDLEQKISLEYYEAAKMPQHILIDVLFNFLIV